jgi:hypothetical protein
MEMSGTIIVDGKEVTLQELLEIQQNPRKKLKKLEEGIFKTLEKLEG